MVPEATVIVDVGKDTYTLPVKLLEKYPNSTMYCAYKFNKKNKKLDFSYRSEKYFEVVWGVYTDDRVKIPPGLTTYDELRECLLFWGFDVEQPVKYTGCELQRVQRTTLQWPWGVWASNGDNVRWVPIVCNFLNLVLSAKHILNVASLGYKNVQIYIKHGVKYDKIGISLILSRFTFLQKLAELHSCYFQVLDGVYGYDVGTYARIQDTVCNNQVQVHEWKYIKHGSFYAECSRKGGDNVEITTNVEFTLEVNIKHFLVSIVISGSQLTWNCTSEYNTTEPILVDDSSGFLIRVTLILGNTMLKHFLVPTCDWLTQPLKINMLKTTTHETSNDNWFCEYPLPKTTTGYVSPLRFPHHTINCVLYEASVMELDLFPVRRHENDVDESVYYERLELSW